MDTSYVLSLTLYTYFFFSTVLFHFFVVGPSESCSFNTTHHNNLIVASVLMHVGLFFASWQAVDLLELEEEIYYLLVFSQFLYGSFCASSSTEILLMLTGALESFWDPVKEEPEGDGFRIECNVCYLGYSKQRVPKLLKDCGHSVCEDCAGRILQKQWYKTDLSCPFCQTKTFVNWSAKNLITNYEVLSLVMILKRRKF
ncbi:unnamed protein product [Caenorhabditis brenneri]